VSFFNCKHDAENSLGMLPIIGAGFGVPRVQHRSIEAHHVQQC
jgi:hypothetical protein